MQPDEMRTIRKAAGLSQGDLAERIGMSLDTISRMERGVPGYPIEKRTALAVRFVLANPDHVEPS